MKTCPYCNFENPKHRILCVNCGKRIDVESNLSKIFKALMWMVGGVVLFVADFEYDLSIARVLPIPYALSIAGAISFVYGFTSLIPRPNLTPEEAKLREKKFIKGGLIFLGILLFCFVLVLTYAYSNS